MASNTTKGVSAKVLSKLQARIENGEFYEASQMYKMLYSRLKNQNKMDEACDLLYNGSVKLLTFSQFASGADLALLLVQGLEYSRAKVTPELIEKLVHIHSLIDPETHDRYRLRTAMIKWTRQDKFKEYGHPMIHQHFALTYWREGNWCQSRYHYMQSTDGEGCGTMLVHFHLSSGYHSEVDLFVAQACLQYLCLKKKVIADQCFQTYTNVHPHVEGGPPYVRPLLNFIWLLLLAVEGGKLTVFTILCEQYQPSLRRDPMYNQYLDRIGQLFFGVPAPPSPVQGSMIGDILQQFLVDDSEADAMSDSSPHATNSSPTWAMQSLTMSSEDVD